MDSFSSLLAGNKEIDQFTKSSVFKVNFSKPLNYPVCLPTSMRKRTDDIYHYHWATEHWHYLSINISLHLKDNLKMTFTEIWNDLKKKTEKWHSLKFLPLGQIEFSQISHLP